VAGRQNFGWGGHTDSVCEVYSGAKIQKTSQKSATKPRRKYPQTAPRRKRAEKTPKNALYNHSIKPVYNPSFKD
jgi:hypothetical protein